MLSQRSVVDAEPDLEPPAASTPEILRVAVVGEGFSRRLLTGSIIVSCLVHIAGAAAMLRSSSATADYGVLTQQTDAISVEMTASTILEADASASVAMAAAAPTATQVGNPVPSSALAVPMTNVEEAAVKEPVVETVKVSEVKPDAVAPVEDPLQVVRGTGEPSDEIATKTAQRTEEDQKETEKKEKVEKEEAKEQQQQSAAQVSGGVTARSIAQADSQAKVSASRGSLLSYAAGIRAKVARNKPAGVGRSGEVQVSFGVTPSGDLNYASLTQSSGNERLDEAALEAIRRSAPFGPPPADASPAQLPFFIPFYFR
jgi:periplasmic protein TonB